MSRLPVLLAAAAGGALLSGAAWAQPTGAPQGPPDPVAPPAQTTTPDQSAAPDQGRSPDDAAPPGARRAQPGPAAGDAAGSGQDTSANAGEQPPPKHEHRSFDYGQTDDGATRAPLPSDDADQRGTSRGEAPPRR